MTNLRTIKSFCKRVAREFRPQKIILFGSYAYGRPTEASDVDLLVIMPLRGSAVSKAVEIEMKVRAPFPLDLLVRTPEKLRQRLALGDWFMRDALQKGRVIYEGADA
ncbi:MAG: nucleotidyltransferase domain-containing protein [Verrucomicrobiota bacterium]|jgi:predicted nucleotidyltransferase